MTKFYYTATKHRRLFAVFAIIIMAFAIFIPTTMQVFGFAPAIVALIPVFQALCAAVGISLAGVAADQLPNAVKDFMFRAPTDLQNWVTFAGAKLIVGTLNKLNITPAVLKDFCTTVKGSIVDVLDGSASYKPDTTTPTNAAGDSNPFVFKKTGNYSYTLPNYQSTYYSNISLLCNSYSISNIFYGSVSLEPFTNKLVYSYTFPRVPLFKVKSTGAIYYLDILNFDKYKGNYQVVVVDASGAPFVAPLNIAKMIIGDSSLTYSSFFLGEIRIPYSSYNGSQPIFAIGTGLTSNGTPCVTSFGADSSQEGYSFTFNPQLVDVLIGDFTFPIDKFGDTAITAGLDTAIDNVADFADAQAIEGVIDIPINIPVDDVGDFVIPIDPTDIIDIATPNPDPPPPDPDPDPPPKPPKPPTDLPDMDVPNVILDKFPFCIPFDLVKSFRLLSAPAVMPEFNIPFKFPAYNIDYTIHLDFKDFDKPIRVWKWFCSFLFVVGLIFLTRKIIGA